MRKSKRKPDANGRKVDWLALDAIVDTSLYRAGSLVKDAWSGYSTFFNRFRLRGPLRIVNEFTSEALTLGVAGFALMLAFAIPAFEEAGDIRLEPYAVTFLDRYGTEIGKRGSLHDDAVPLEEIPDIMIKATLATEDRRFFSHFGIDVMGTLRAMAENVKADAVVQGGSSLTQQLAKNLFLSSERTLDRKIKEAFLAMWLETRYTKREILKMYLDKAYMGGGAIGVEGASQFYFGKSIREVNLAEAAMLAGLFTAPTRYAPHINLPAARARANEVLENMVQAGFVTAGQVFGARTQPAQIIERPDYYAPDWFLDWAFEEVQRIMKASGKSDVVLTARTTVDIQLQKAADQAVESVLRKTRRSRRTQQAALVSMETDGAVRAMVGGRDYGESQFNRAAHALRQPGSSFKSYVYLSALKTGKYNPRSIVVDGPVGCGRWSPKNYAGGYSGRMTLTTAIARSINTIAVKLSLQVDREKVLEDLRKMGITRLKKTCSMALGDQGLTPLEHTGGYATFANGGFKVTPYAIEEINNSKGDLLFLHERDVPKPERIFDEKPIEQLNQMLRAVVTEGTAKAAELDFTYVAGKTGTSSAYRDAWFIGYTGQYVTGVWFGNDDFKPMGRITGGSLPAQVWKAYNVPAHVSMAIPQIAGLPLHPVQQEEQNRIALLQKDEPTAESAPSASLGMPDQTREVLNHLSELLRDAGSVEPKQAEAEPASSAAGAASEQPFGDTSGAASRFVRRP